MRTIQQGRKADNRKTLIIALIWINAQTPPGLCALATKISFAPPPPYSRSALSVTVVT